MKSLLALLLIAQVFAQPTRADDYQRHKYKKGHLLVKLVAGASQDDISDSVIKVGASLMKAYTIVPGLLLYRFDHNRKCMDEAMDAFKSHHAVEFIEPDYWLEASATPNDPFFVNQWGLRNTAQFGGVAGA